MNKITVSIYIDDIKKKIKYNNYLELIYDLYSNKGVVKDQKIIDEISNTSECIPMFDIYSQNIYLITADNIKENILKYNYRPINTVIYNYIKEINAYMQLIFLKNYNLNILESLYDKIMSEYDFTSCIIPSFLPILYTTTPYYTKTELIMMAKNMNIYNDSSNNIHQLCDIVKSNDFTYNDLLTHHDYIKKTFTESFFKNYTFFKSATYNSYLRFPSEYHRDILLEKEINTFKNSIINSPKWNKSYYVYRWIHDDNYLQHLKIGDIYSENGFMSTTRNNFVDPKSSYFGRYLIKIKIPSGVKGCGIAIEYFSIFPNEFEILFAPCHLKLINLSNTVYHNNYVSDKTIISKYEFEWISNYDDYINKKLYKSPLIINHLDLNTEILNTSDSNINEKLNLFINKYSHKFYTNIGPETVLFDLQYMMDDPYKEFFYFKNKKNSNSIFLVWNDPITSSILLFIEIDEYMSVNYYFRYIGNRIKLIGNQTYDDIIIFLKKLANLFNIDKIKLHPDYNNYGSIIDKSIFKKINYYSFHIRNMYIADTYYFNESLNFIITNITSNFTQFLKINYKRLKIKMVFNMTGFNELINISLNNFLDVIKKYLSSNNVYYSLLYNICSLLVKKSKHVDKYLLIDLYVYLFKHYYYLLLIVYEIIIKHYKIDIDDIYYLI